MKTEDFCLSEELVLIDIEAEDQLAALKQLGELLYQKGYVKDTYPLAVQQREKVYPTGLPTIGVGVAIPHTDVEHVNTPAVAIGTLRKPVKFRVMGNPEEEVEIELIFMLAIKQPQMQLQMLQSFTYIFEKKELLITLKNLKSPQEVIALVKGALMGDSDKIA